MPILNTFENVHLNSGGSSLTKLGVQLPQALMVILGCHSLPYVATSRLLLVNDRNHDHKFRSHVIKLRCKAKIWGTIAALS